MSFLWVIWIITLCKMICQTDVWKNDDHSWIKILPTYIHVLLWLKSVESKQSSPWSNRDIPKQNSNCNIIYTASKKNVVSMNHYKIQQFLLNIWTWWGEFTNDFCWSKHSRVQVFVVIIFRKSCMMPWGGSFYNYCTVISYDIFLSILYW